MTLDEDGASIIVVMMMVVVVLALAVEPTLPIEGSVAVIPMRTVDDDVVVVAVMVAVDMGAASPIEIAAVVLGRRRGGSED
ncbi:hypothetical protein [Methylobacterium sp. J-092]|uniref:hypothetical protein n=1 Tax=Methylobacterium sp. J-092 TaxID=2836667 RepID=UPI001FBA3102|nr:hypothetical protein [Methylobacterium sp. J-092]MCJ2010778.1 hypothetical protein [Methylobacterium sp. J-092]